MALVPWGENAEVLEPMVTLVQQQHMFISWKCYMGHRSPKHTVIDSKKKMPGSGRSIAIGASGVEKILRENGDTDH